MTWRGVCESGPFKRRVAIGDALLFEGDCLEVLKALPAESVHCVVTSPAYWGLRDYGTATWEGGDPDCQHQKGRPGSDRADGIVGMVTHRNRDGAGAFSGDCKCGARRIDLQLGLESTPQEYVDRMVTVFREVRRVLREDGTCWINLGDSYCGSWGNAGNRPELDKKGGTQRQKNGEYFERGGWDSRRDVPPNQKITGLKPKDLVGIPWRVAFALQADGWYLRSEITWCKKAPMPESVTDRPTSATEKIFLLTKSESYYYDADAVRNPPSEAMLREVAEGYNGHAVKMFEDAGAQNASDVKSRIIENARKRVDKQRGHGRRHAGFNDRWDGMTKEEQMACGSNMRNYWLIGPSPFPEAHFATFPLEIPMRCILAGCPTGGTVLDPFAGSSTTALAAVKHERKCIGIELNPDYLPLRAEAIENAQRQTKLFDEPQPKQIQEEISL